MGAVVLEGAVVQHFGDRIETLNGRRNKKLLDLKVNNNLLYTTDLIIYEQKIIKLKGQLIEIKKQQYLFKRTLILTGQVIIYNLQVNTFSNYYFIFLLVSSYACVYKQCRFNPLVKIN